MGHYDRYWEMEQGGPYDEPSEKEKIFKCTDCGAETHHPKGFDGEPDATACHPGCRSHASDWRPGRVSSVYLNNIETVRFDKETPYADKGKGDDEQVKAIRAFKHNFDAIFPAAPGAGL